MDQDWGQVVKNEDIDVHVKIWDNVIESWENVFVFVLVVNNKIGDNNVMKKDLILDSGYKLSRLGIILSRISRFGMSRVGTI